MGSLPGPGHCNTREVSGSEKGGEAILRVNRIHDLLVTF